MVQLTRGLTIAYSGALDIILTILPWKIIWGVAINKREKVGALVAMSFGVLYASHSRLRRHCSGLPLWLLYSSAIMSFLKIPSLSNISDANCKPSISFLPSHQFSRGGRVSSYKATNVDVKIFGTAEPAVTIMAISIPVLRAFIRKDAARKTRSVRFIQFSQTPEPSGGRSAPSFEKKYAGDSDVGLVSHSSMPSQASGRPAGC